MDHTREINETIREETVYQRIKSKKKHQPLENNVENGINSNVTTETLIASPSLFFQYPNDINLNLMEEILLCGIKDNEGHTSLWNDSISIALRGAALIELGLSGRIELDQSYSRRILYGDRIVVVKNSENVGNHILDEILTTMSSTNEPISLSNWLYYLTGETWNPFKLVLQVKRLRDRLSKMLAEKRVLMPNQQDFVVFSLTTYPVCNISVKFALINRIKEILLYRWCDQLYLKDIRSFCLVTLAYAANVIDNILFTLSNDEYIRAAGVVSKISSYDLANVIQSLTSQLHKSDSTEHQPSIAFKKLEFVLAVIQTLCQEI